jgi:hypothetical protein
MIRSKDDKERGDTSDLIWRQNASCVLVKETAFPIVVQVKIDILISFAE